MGLSVRDDFTSMFSGNLLTLIAQEELFDCLRVGLAL